MSAYILNPKTNRFVLKSGPVGKRLIKSEPMIAGDVTFRDGGEKDEIDIIAGDKIEQSAPITSNDIKGKMAEVSADIIKDNKRLFKNSKNMTDDELDTLLKQLLYKKLCGSSESITKPKKPKKKSIKRRKKLKKKKRFIITSSDESDNSDSESD
jgi:hypothetical protein